MNEPIKLQENIKKNLDNNNACMNKPKLHDFWRFNKFEWKWTI